MAENDLAGARALASEARAEAADGKPEKALAHLREAAEVYLAAENLNVAETEEYAQILYDQTDLLRTLGRGDEASEALRAAWLSSDQEAAKRGRAAALGIVTSTPATQPFAAGNQTLRTTAAYMLGGVSFDGAVGDYARASLALSPQAIQREASPVSVPVKSSGMSTFRVIQIGVFVLYLIIQLSRCSS